MNSHLKNITLAMCLAITSIGLYGCGDDGQKTATEAAKTAADDEAGTWKNANIGKPGYDERGNKYDPIFNPSPEMRAKQLEEEQKAMPWISKLKAPAVADRGQYLDLTSPQMLIKLYHGFRAWDESADDIAKSFGPVLPNTRANLPEFDQLVENHRKETNAFNKADAAKALKA